MSDRTFEDMLGRVLKHDFSEGTDEFRESLLSRCLAELNEDYREAELDDDELEFLAAAGDLTQGSAFFFDSGSK